MGPSTFSSTKLARPSQIFRTTVVPSYSAHSLDPLNGCFSLHRWVCHFPNSQSKTCCPSRADAEFSCSSPGTALTISNKPRLKNLPIIHQTITRFPADTADELWAGSAAATALAFLVSQEVATPDDQAIATCRRRRGFGRPRIR